MSTVNTVRKWWHVLDEADSFFRRSPYVNCYLDLRGSEPDLLLELAGWFRRVADVVEEGAKLKENHNADA